MSKAEKFIEDYTRNCSNQSKWGVETPNKSIIYVQPWLTPDDARRAVEIAREEVIEKVCEFLENDLCCYIEAQNFTIEHLRLENDLKQALKDE